MRKILLILLVGVFAVTTASARYRYCPRGKVMRTIVTQKCNRYMRRKWVTRRVCHPVMVRKVYYTQVCHKKAVPTLSGQTVYQQVCRKVPHSRMVRVQSCTTRRYRTRVPVTRCRKVVTRRCVWR